jgi:hypothetical protein
MTLHQGGNEAGRQGEMMLRVLKIAVISLSAFVLSSAVTLAQTPPPSGQTPAPAASHSKHKSSTKKTGHKKSAKKKARKKTAH